jgi:hypothetical protein
MLILLINGAYGVFSRNGITSHDLFARFHKDWHASSINLKFCNNGITDCNVGVNDMRTDRTRKQLCN